MGAGPVWGRAGKPRDLAVTRTACRIAGVGICVPAWVSPEQAQHFPSCVPQARQPGGSSLPVIRSVLCRLLPGFILKSKTH